MAKWLQIGCSYGETTTVSRGAREKENYMLHVREGLSAALSGYAETGPVITRAGSFLAEEETRRPARAALPVDRGGGFVIQ